MDINDIERRVRRIRRKVKTHTISLTDLTRASGVAWSTVCRVLNENNKRTPYLGTVVLLENGLKKILAKKAVTS